MNRRKFLNFLAATPLVVAGGAMARGEVGILDLFHTAIDQQRLEMPPGTKMAFQQTKAPRGWNKTGKAVANFRRVSGTVCEKI